MLSRAHPRQPRFDIAAGSLCWLQVALCLQFDEHSIAVPTLCLWPAVMQAMADLDEHTDRLSIAVPLDRADCAVSDSAAARGSAPHGLPAAVCGYGD